MSASKKTKNIWDLAMEIGLCPIVCQCGERIDGAEAIEEFFQKIIGVCKDGGEVRIKNFGTFSAKVLKGRNLKTSIADKDETDFEDVLVLRFRGSPVCKKEINKRKGKNGKQNKDKS